MTPPGSACSVVIGPTVVSADADRGPGASFQLVVADVDAARAELAGRGVEVSPVQTLDPRDGGKFVFFADPTATTGPCRRSGSASGPRSASARPAQG